MNVPILNAQKAPPPPKNCVPRALANPQAPRPDTDAAPETSMPPAKKRARESASLEWLVPESRVEVVMEEPGLVGSRYPARVLQVKAGKAQVEFPRLR